MFIKIEDSMANFRELSDEITESFSKLYKDCNDKEKIIEKLSYTLAYIYDLYIDLKREMAEFDKFI